VVCSSTSRARSDLTKNKNIVVQNFVATHFMSITESYNFHGPGGLAQCTSHPPLEQEDPGSNPARL
jgi:hypothetical protein